MINWGELDGRVDPSYYKKEYRELESLVLKQGCYKLRDFIKTMAGGATPKTTESEKYYSDDGKGLPFLRVQNLSPDGLKLDNCKLINYVTHNNMLARSKVFSGDLLTKITGVGRMAVSSIAPIGFEGNINQHLVVIKTENEQTSRLLANFLNSDVGEKLASRRSTGGTRPALDYTALRSIPIILSEESIAIMDDAYAEKQQKEKEAQELLDSINSYLLGELGIAMPPEKENTLESRKFYASSADVLGGRFDPRKYTKKYYDIFDALQNSLFPKKQLREIVLSDVAGNWGLDETEEGSDLISCLTIRATEFDNKYNLNLDNNRTKYRKYPPRIFVKIMLSHEDILIEKSGGSDDQPVGRVAFIEKEMADNLNLAYSNFIHKIIVDKEKADPRFVFEYLRLMHNIKVTQVMQTQTNGIRNLIMGEYFRQTIILPDINTQRTIACEASAIRNKAKQLEQEAEDAVKSAKAQVEKILLEGSL